MTNEEFLDALDKLDHLDQLDQQEKGAKVKAGAQQVPADVQHDLAPTAGDYKDSALAGFKRGTLGLVGLEPGDLEGIGASLKTGLHNIPASEFLSLDDLKKHPLDTARGYLDTMMNPVGHLGSAAAKFAHANNPQAFDQAAGQAEGAHEDLEQSSGPLAFAGSEAPGFIIGGSGSGPEAHPIAPGAKPRPPGGSLDLGSLKAEALKMGASHLPFPFKQVAGAGLRVAQKAGAFKAPKAATPDLPYGPLGDLSDLREPMARPLAEDISSQPQRMSGGITKFNIPPDVGMKSPWTDVGFDPTAATHTPMEVVGPAEDLGPLDVSDRDMVGETDDSEGTVFHSLPPDVKAARPPGHPMDTAMMDAPHDPSAEEIPPSRLGMLEDIAPSLEDSSDEQGFPAGNDPVLRPPPKSIDTENARGRVVGRIPKLSEIQNAANTPHDQPLDLKNLQDEMDRYSARGRETNAGRPKRGMMRFNSFGDPIDENLETELDQQPGGRGYLPRSLDDINNRSEARPRESVRDNNQNAWEGVRGHRGAVSIDFEGPENELQEYYDGNPAGAGTHPATVLEVTPYGTSGRSGNVVIRVQDEITGEEHKFVATREGQVRHVSRDADPGRPLREGETLTPHERRWRRQQKAGRGFRYDNARLRPVRAEQPEEED